MRFILAASVLCLVAALGCGSSANDLFAQAGAGGDDGGGGTGGNACKSECTQGEARCEQDGVQRCMADSHGCATWGAPEACPTDQPYCSNGACAANCFDECSQAASRTCLNNGYRTCGQFDADPCLDWSTVVSCGPGEVCRASDADCVLDCGSSTCPCNPGDTKACDNIGECKGGVRNCVNGEFGACQWQQGPQNEICDGKDNDCDGIPDDDLVAQPCDKQAGVCTGSVKICKGGAWQACTDADYLAYASAHGGTYEPTETSCDGKDNDCDGAVDEPTGCCSPSCSGKACGADDGCGKKCQNGPCGANATCQSGSCACAFKGCGNTCCASGQSCVLNQCETPACDPLPGQATATCTGGKACYTNGNEPVCQDAGSAGPGAACCKGGSVDETWYSDYCVPGYTCSGIDGHCVQYCMLGNSAPCPQGTTCSSIGPYEDDYGIGDCE